MGVKNQDLVREKVEVRGIEPLSEKLDWTLLRT